tara:strand:+ start:235 stop:387 length:153 start_codon:yes stop_codon:yes gene_type:complete
LHQGQWFLEKPKRYIPPDDMDDVILARMITEAWAFYEIAKKRERGELKQL